MGQHRGNRLNLFTSEKKPEWTKAKYLNIFGQLYSFCLKHTRSLAGQLAVTSGKGERQLGRSSSSAGITRSVKGLLSLAFLHSRHTLHMTNLFFKRKPQNPYPKNSAAAAFLLRGRLSYGLVLVWEVRKMMVFAVIGLIWKEWPVKNYTKKERNATQKWDLQHLLVPLNLLECWALASWERDTIWRRQKTKKREEILNQLKSVKCKHEKTNALWKGLKFFALFFNWQAVPPGPKNFIPGPMWTRSFSFFF